MQIVKSSFGTLIDGRDASIFKLKNSNGVSVSITNYGAALVSIITPDRHGAQGEIILGYDNVGHYENDSLYMGSIIGRCANRVANSRFTLNGATYDLSQNEGVHHLHGGAVGFSKRLWDYDNTWDRKPLEPLVLTHNSYDGDQGYPGDLNCRVSFYLDEGNCFEIRYMCSSNKPTPVNLTHHPYFNLTNGGDSSALGHELTINADLFLPLDDDQIPLGTVAGVKEKIVDFRMRASIHSKLEQAERASSNGFNVCYVLKNKKKSVNWAATIFDPSSGRQLDIFTTEPALQFYSGGGIGEDIPGRNRQKYSNGFGICLEPQKYINAQNQANFPSITLSPEEDYLQITRFQFCR